MNIDILFESALLLAAVSFSLGLYVLSRGVSNKLNLSYFALTITVSSWAFSFFIARVLHWRFFDSVHLISNLLLPAFALQCLKELLMPEGAFFKRLRHISIAIPFVLIPMVVYGLDSFSGIRELVNYTPSLIFITCVYLFLSEALGQVKPRGTFLRLNYFWLSSAEMFSALKKRNFWLYLGGAFVTLICALDHAPWMGRTVPAIGNLILILYFYYIKDAILEHRLLSARKILGRLLAHIISAIVIAWVFVAITTWVKHSQPLFLLNAFLAAYVAVVSVDPMFNLVKAFFEKFFFQEASKVDLFIKEASKEIAGAFHERAIADATKNFLEKTLFTKMISFYALNADGKKFHKIADFSEKQNLPDFLSSAFAPAQIWLSARSWKPILEAELEVESARNTLSALSARYQLARESLLSLQSTIMLPLTYNRAVLGFATIDATEPPASWDESWAILALLRPYFERAGEALHELDTYAQLRERDRLATIGEMAAGLAHEIRNPLGAIKGAAQVIDAKPGDVNEPFLKIIIEEVNRLNGVVSQFLNYAKPFQAEHRFANLKDIVADGVGRFQRKMSTEIPVSVSCDFIGDEFNVLCQPELLGQVLSNLLDNAHQAILIAAKQREDIWKIRVNLECIEKNNEIHVQLSVSDNGIGISADAIDKIFIPFFTSSPQGTGLGLPICQKIVEAHWGRIDVLSTLGEGTQMTVRFNSPKKFSGGTYAQRI